MNNSTAEISLIPVNSGQMGPQIREIYSGSTQIGYAGWSCDKTGEIILRDFVIDKQHDEYHLRKMALESVLNDIKQSWTGSRGCEIRMIIDHTIPMDRVYSDIGFTCVKSDDNSAEYVVVM